MPVAARHLAAVSRTSQRVNRSTMPLYRCYRVTTATIGKVSVGRGALAPPPTNRTPVSPCHCERRRSRSAAISRKRDVARVPAPTRLPAVAHRREIPRGRNGTQSFTHAAGRGRPALLAGAGSATRPQGLPAAPARLPVAAHRREIPRNRNKNKRTRTPRHSPVRFPSLTRSGSESHTQRLRVAAYKITP